MDAAISQLTDGGNGVVSVVCVGNELETNHEMDFRCGMSIWKEIGQHNIDNERLI